MKQVVLRVDYCENCNKKEEIFVRSHYINSCLSDSDIYRIIAARGGQPQNYVYCDKCRCTTLKTTVAWKGA